jgi:hypothetical protein
MVPKMMGVVVAFFQKLHIVHLCLRASLLFEFSYHVKILSKFFSFVKVIVKQLKIVGKCKLCFPLLSVGVKVLFMKLFFFPIDFNASFLCL